MKNMLSLICCLMIILSSMAQTNDIISSTTWAFPVDVGVVIPISEPQNVASLVRVGLMKQIAEFALFNSENAGSKYRSPLFFGIRGGGYRVSSKNYKNEDILSSTVFLEPTLMLLHMDDPGARNHNFGFIVSGAVCAQVTGDDIKYSIVPLVGVNYRVGNVFVMSAEWNILKSMNLTFGIRPFGNRIVKQ